MLFFEIMRKQITKYLLKKAKKMKNGLFLFDYQSPINYEFSLNYSKCYLKILYQRFIMTKSLNILYAIKKEEYAMACVVGTTCCFNISQLLKCGKIVFDVIESKNSPHKRQTNCLNIAQHFPWFHMLQLEAESLKQRMINNNPLISFFASFFKI